MSVDKLVDSTQLNADLTSVANAIRTKGGTSAQLAFPNGFVSAIDAIPTGGTLITKTITANGTYSAEDDNADGYSEVTVNVSGGEVDPYHLKITGDELFFCFGGADWVNSKAAINANYDIRRSIWMADGDTNVYHTNTTRTLCLHLIPIPSNATTITLTIDKTCQVSIREYWGSGSNLTNSDATSWIDVTENTGVVHTLTSGTSYVGFSLRVNTSNSAYSRSTEPTIASIDFS